MIISRGPIAEKARPNEVLAELAKKYGIHGAMLNTADQSMVEVKQLDFSLREGSYIPEEEMNRFREAVFQFPETFRAFKAGAQYNVFVGEWLHMGEDGYDELRKLNIIAII